MDLLSAGEHFKGAVYDINWNRFIAPERPDPEALERAGLDDSVADEDTGDWVFTVSSFGGSEFRIVDCSFPGATFNVPAAMLGNVAAGEGPTVASGFGGADWGGGGGRRDSLGSLLPSLGGTAANERRGSVRRGSVRRGSVRRGSNQAGSLDERLASGTSMDALASATDELSTMTANARQIANDRRESVRRGSVRRDSLLRRGSTRSIASAYGGANALGASMGDVASGASMDAEGKVVSGHGKWSATCGPPMQKGTHSISIEVVNPGLGCWVGVGQANAKGAARGAPGSQANPLGSSLSAKGTAASGNALPGETAGFAAGDVITITVYLDASGQPRMEYVNQDGKVLHSELLTTKRKKAPKKEPMRRTAREPARPPYNPADPKSVWFPRIQWSDGKDLYDHEEVKLFRFENDWRRALRLGILKLVMRYDDDANVDADGDGIPDEVEDVASVLWQNYDLWTLLFTYYCHSESSADPQMSWHEWTLLTHDCNLVDKRSEFCKSSDLDRLFLAVDSMGAMAQKEKEGRGRVMKATSTKPAAVKREATANRLAVTVEHGQVSDLQSLNRSEQVRRVSEKGVKDIIETDRQKSFSRTEFMTALVYLAINKYVRSHMYSDVSDALERLLKTDITPVIGNRLPIPDHLRLRHAYTEGVEQVLRKHHGMLSALFTSMTGGGKALLSIDAWMGLMRATEMMPDGEWTDLSAREASFCFFWSRMMVIDEETVAGQLKASKLPKEGFMEALIRVARLKALPTAADLAAAECADAGAFMALMRANPTEQRAWMATARHEEWDGTVVNPSQPEMPMRVMLDNLLMIIQYTIQQDMVDGAVDGAALQHDHVAKWVLKHHIGRERLG